MNAIPDMPQHVAHPVLVRSLMSSKAELRFAECANMLTRITKEHSALGTNQGHQQQDTVYVVKIVV